MKALFATHLKGDRTIWMVALVLGITSLLAVYSACSWMAWRNDGGTLRVLAKHGMMLAAGGLIQRFVHADEATGQSPFAFEWIEGALDQQHLKFAVVQTEDHAVHSQGRPRILVGVGHNWLTLCGVGSRLSLQNKFSAEFHEQNPQPVLTRAISAIRPIAVIPGVLDQLRISGREQ